MQEPVLSNYSKIHLPHEVLLVQTLQDLGLLKSDAVAKGQFPPTFLSI